MADMDIRGCYIKCPVEVFDAVARESRQSGLTRNNVWLKAMRNYLNLSEPPISPAVAELREMEHTIHAIQMTDRPLVIQLFRAILGVFRHRERKNKKDTN